MLQPTLYEDRAPEHLISIIIPALNEKEHIGSTMMAVDQVLKQAGYQAELIIVDDGSTDGTADEVNRTAHYLAAAVHLIRLTTPQGKGHAVATGFRVTRGHIVGFIDADQEYPPAALPAMIESMAEQVARRCVIAVRTQDERPRLERLTSRLAHFVAGSLLQLKVYDTQAGLKVFPGWFARQIIAQPDMHGWLYDLEALMAAVEHRIQIVEMPVTQKSVRPRRASVGVMLHNVTPLLRLSWKHWKRQWRAHRVQPHLAQVARFGMVGLSSTMIDLGVFWGLTRLWPPGFQGWLAALEGVGGWAVASVFGWAMHSRITFRSRLPAGGFYFVTASGVVMQSIVTGAITQLYGSSDSLEGKCLGIVFGSMVTFFGYRQVAHYATEPYRGSALIRRFWALLGVVDPTPVSLALERSVSTEPQTPAIGG